MKITIFLPIWAILKSFKWFIHNNLKKNDTVSKAHYENYFKNY